ncbi:TPA: alanine--tRNA ligase [Candidatus Woesearchaeota archaeon]|nr:alanine--tRNA ligase [Candidatus Woesearchaeota archaeon]
MIRPDKEVKREFKGIASAHPDKYYATRVLKREGFERKRCACGTAFWTVNENQIVCGDPTCSGGFRLFENNPAKHQMTYVQTWQAFAKMFEQKGYKVMNRYPVVARWNPTMEYTIASIAAFQPHVVNGDVEAPAKRLVIPQFCLRFGDIDNVGITGSHLTGFIMIGQHMFVPPNEWDQDAAFQDLYDWFTQGLGLPKEEITLHEDAWAGGGNFGPCMEFFSRGVELGNQVYMLYEQTPDGDKDLKIKVLDMGMGMERNAWFSQGKGTAYDATFPLVISRILERTHHTPNIELQKRFLPKASYLNIDETDDIQSAWERVAKELGVDASSLRAAIEPMQAVYSIAEHARSLLFALSDGGLPSNVGGGYNLRTIFRRAQGFIERHNWDLDMGEVATWHAEELQAIFPELLANIAETRAILAVEKEKHVESRKKAQQVLENEHKKSGDAGISIGKLIELYDSCGLHPDAVSAFVKSRGGKPLVVPDNFFQLVSERHEKQEQKTATRKSTHFPVDGLARTAPLYLTSYDLLSFNAKVMRVFDEKHVVLDQTAFYPTSGGQEHDTGTITGKDGIAYNVVDVIKQGGIIIHVLENEPGFDEGDVVEGKVDWTRRQQLAQHHTATHIINGAARKVLGNHVWQAGAAKTTEKARIDITHYNALSDDELRSIEEEANRVIRADIHLHHGLVPKRDAEAQHGFRLYQGGAVPGKEIRVVDIPGFDVEACGGTHLNHTGEAVMIKILKASKIQDGIVRIEYVAGDQAKWYVAEREALLATIREALDVETDAMIPSATENLFAKWKKARKGPLTDWKDSALIAYNGDPLTKAAEILQTQPQTIIPTIKRFIADIERAQKD